MRNGFSVLAVVGLLTAGGLSACTGEEDSGSGAETGPAVQVGVILPDTRSSARWATADFKYLTEAFEAAGVEAVIQNAEGDKTRFTTIADGMIASGVKVLIIANLDSGTGQAVLAKARTAGIATIDYDRLTLGGGADYYVSFDNTEVGKLQGQGLVDCLTEKRVVRPVVSYLNGSATDNNSTLLKKGYDSVLQPKFDSGEYLKGPDQDVPEWDSAQGGTIFEQQLTQDKSITGVLAANDGLGNAAIQVLKKNKLNGKVPVTGQDATVLGLQNILIGDQCMTVYKAIKKEADAAAELAIALVKQEQVSTTETIEGTGTKAVLLAPQAITAATVKDVVADGYVTREELCSADFAEACAKVGIR
ncbi:sugar ABC transporter substrate-binding protein [Actinoplanes derwentensis]|uniref:Monosaccharide ABC transporter substrate-binding protein, CUT2 family n=1 Tax=Actinoplanes derwentensis TaxID=113562 RepID=A0A1H2CKZ4_9ACTN|nr:substrate-binding domain-containing protein [Actinoplanes derwentensis]GID82686.1 sugar ABC transporter substrate-binding protein [Actinoplanes derwentensis]SDT70999.1 monosaccharide ABC transporter substrate-binding protein, CUT2 family [Actinoplanes derwentensis]